MLNVAVCLACGYAVSWLACIVHQQPCGWKDAPVTIATASLIYAAGFMGFCP